MKSLEPDHFYAKLSIKIDVPKCFEITVDMLLYSISSVTNKNCAPPKLQFVGWKSSPNLTCLKLTAPPPFFDHPTVLKPIHSSFLGMAILTRFQLHKTLGCSEAVMQNWLIIIEANYKRNNAYHNSTHAADVLHATAFFLEQDSVKEMCDGVDEATCLLAGL